MRSKSLTALQSTLRVSLLLFSLMIVTLYIAIISVEQSYPKQDPNFPKKQSYICFPQENDESQFMNVLRIIDIICSVFLVGVCTAFQMRPSVIKLHWPISLLSASRFIIVLFEIVHVSSVTGDTQLDIILSVNDGTCKVSENQRLIFRALYAIFVLRCVKGFLTITMGSLAYGNSIVIVLFGFGTTDNDYSVEEQEMDEIGESLSK